MMIVVYILLFILCLSVLIAVHEAGHLATAKIFKVYCFEYSLGFGPKIFSKKRKDGETYFSIRAIPFGGFVSMYGESDTVPEGMEIDPSRSLLSIKKWKRAIIMAAGVTMNFLLAIFIFLIYEAAFPMYTARYGHVQIANNSLAGQAGVKSNDSVYATVYEDSNNTFIFYDDKALLTYEDTSTTVVYVGFNYKTIAIKDTAMRNRAVCYERVDFSNYVKGSYPATTVSEVLAKDYSGDEFKVEEITGFLLATSSKKAGTFYQVRVAIAGNYGEKDPKYIIANFTFDEEQYNKFVMVPMNEEITIAGDIFEGEKTKEVRASYCSTSYPDAKGNNLFAYKKNNVAPSSLTFDMYVVDEATPTGRGVGHEIADIALEASGDNYLLPNNIGISMQLDEKRNNFGEALKETFIDFGDSAVLIFRGLGQLFTPEGFKNVGGIIAIGVGTTQALQQNGFGVYLYYWGLISVNLGIVNLLPFPGLDGWHLLVIAVEGIFKKEIPSKVKNAIAMVGVIILLALTAVILIKDVIGLF